VNEEIVEDLRQQMEQNSKKSLRKLSLQADVPLSTCQKIVRKNLNFYPYKITTLQEPLRILLLVFKQFER
jgi:hypothetical protein